MSGEMGCTDVSLRMSNVTGPLPAVPPAPAWPDTPPNPFPAAPPELLDLGGSAAQPIQAATKVKSAHRIRTDFRINDSYLLLWIGYWTQSELALAASQFFTTVPKAVSEVRALSENRLGVHELSVTHAVQLAP